MNLLSELHILLEPFDIDIETGVFNDKPSKEYIVITPLIERFEVFSDDMPSQEIQHARISLFSKGNYLSIKNTITKVLLRSGITITERRYIAYEHDTGYHHYAIDVAKIYGIKEE